MQDAASLTEPLVAIGILRPVVVDGKRKLATHPLFRKYVAERFETLSPAHVLELRYAAARTYVRHASPVEAVRVAADTGDGDFIGEIVEACDPALTWILHGAARLRQLVRLVPDPVFRTHPRVGYARVISWIKDGRLKDAQRLFDELDTLEPPEAQGRAGAVERDFSRCLLAIYKGTSISDEEIARVERLAASRKDLAPTLLCLANTLRCYRQQHASQFRTAQESARRAMRDAELGESPYAAYFMYCDLAMISGVLGEAREAFSLFQQGDRACLAAIRADERLTLIRDAFRLELEHERDPFEATGMARLRNLSLRLPRLEGWLDVFAAVYRTYSKKLYLGENLAAALAVIEAG
ncbi:MAG: hypothetical protein ABUL69_05490, partial [Peristeroidobacter soli]